jgi:alpha-L-arabinofuranosidase
VSTDFAASIQLHDFAAAGTVLVHVLTSDSISDVNDEVNRNKVETRDSTEAIEPRGWAHVFPRESVTMIAIDRKIVFRR